jgi:hypothetical protein
VQTYDICYCGGCKLVKFSALPFNCVMAFTTKRLFGYVGYLRIWESLFLIQILCIVTTRVLFRLLTTQFFMNELSTLKLIVILFVIISSLAPSFAFCFFFFADCRFLYQVTLHFPFLFSSWQTLHVCKCHIVSLRGDVKKYIYFVLFIKGRIIFLV